MKKKKKGYVSLLLLAILFTLAAISTVIPITIASKECLLGYNAHCSFTPISTIICLIVVAILCIIRRRRFVEKD